MSNYKTTIRVTLFIVTALLVGVSLGIMLERAALRDAYTDARQGDKLSWALSEIEERYVDPITRDSLAELALPLLLQDLDPHSVYIPASEFAATNEPLTGTFDGIGVMFNMLTDTVQITNVISGGPSAAAGIVAGDRIITVDDSTIAGVKMDQDKVVGMLRGKRGSTVKLGILRAPAQELLPVTITRGAIPVKSLEAAFIVPGKPEVGYIKFGRFAATTHSEVLAALMQLREQGVRKVILDLRGNGGGYLDQAIYIANEFLPKGHKIVYTEGHASPRADQNADGRGRFQDIELAVVIDENSASASEIVAGAIQDNDRGVIVGRRSFGKGLVQEQIPYPLDGSAMRLTIARYYTPVGRSIQKPYTPGHGDDYNGELIRRYEHNEMLTADSIHLTDSLK
ncbi:MAG: S41 family peptidase, partial [Rikenellaceae bacterium]|nr:S41 family peptidase [Rikenellaceae bacterium]